MKKMISLVLALALMLSVMPVLPAAAEETETTAPTETVAVPAEEPAAPAEETTAPAGETTAPTEAVTVPTEETTAPAEETTAPAEETVPTEETGPETETVTVEADAETGMLAAQSGTPEKIGVGESRTITLKSGEEVRYSFTPETTGKYVFHWPEEEYNEGVGFFDLDIFKDHYNAGEYVSNGSYTGKYCTMEAGVEYTLIVANRYGDADITGTVYFDVLREADAFSLTLSAGSISPGSWFGLDVEDIQPENAYVLGTVWTVSNECVASVSYPYDGYAEFNVMGEGTATVTATAGNGVSASYEVNVKPPEKIELGQSKTLTLGKGEKATFTFTPETTGEYVFHMPIGVYHPEEQFSEQFDLNIYKDGELIWGYVGNGVYVGSCCTMKKGEEYTLTASYPYGGNIDSITGTVTLDVLKEAAAFTLIPSGAIYMGSCFDLYIMDLMPEDAYALDVTWTVSDPKVVSIAKSGDGGAEFDAVGAGAATVTATAGNGASASYQVTVKAPEKWDGLGSKTVTLDPGDESTFFFTPETSGAYLFTTPYGASTNYRTFNLSVLEYGIDVVDSYVFNSSGQGVYCVMEAGTEYVLTVSNDFDTTLTAEVSLEPYKEPEAISIGLFQIYNETAYPADYLNVGAPIDYEIIAYPESEYAAGITLTSSDPSILSITKAGHGYNLSANKPGTVTVTATTKGGITATREVTVRDGDPLPILEGANSVVTRGNPLSVRIDGEMEKLEEVWVGGGRLTAKDYTVTEAEDGVIVTLLPEYLSIWKDCTFTLNVYFSNGWAATTFEITSAVLGDLNGDGKIAALDAAMVYAAVNNKKVLTDAEAKAADVDGNGKIQAKDASMVYAHVNNKLDKFPAEK